MLNFNTLYTWTIEKSTTDEKDEKSKRQRKSYEQKAQEEEEEEEEEERNIHVLVPGVAIVAMICSTPL